MQVYDLLSAVMGNYRSMFADLAGMINRRYASGNHRPTGDELPVPKTETTIPTPVDSYQPSGTSESTAAPTYDKPAAATQESGQADEKPADETTLPVGDTGVTEPENPPADATYQYQRKARLDYELVLKFDLSAMMSTVEKLADGEIESVEKLAAAGFGLTTDLKLHGFEAVQETVDETDGAAVRTKQKALAFGRNAGAFQVQSRDFKMRSAYNNMTRLRNSSKVDISDGVRRALNKFSLRYRTDNQFSFAFAERFKVQTDKVTEGMPEVANQYVDTAGDVALNGTTEMMATFFDAVDGYLGEAEASTLESVSKFFNMAAEQLGFSGEMVALAEKQLTDTVEIFFDRVQQAVSEMATRFVPEAAEPTQPVDTGELPVGEPAEYVAPEDASATADRGQLAVA